MSEAPKILPFSAPSNIDSTFFSIHVMKTLSVNPQLLYRGNFIREMWSLVKEAKEQNALGAGEHDKEQPKLSVFPILSIQRLL